MFENIPQEMRQYKNWVCFKKVKKTDKQGNERVSKVPYNPLTGHHAKSNDPKTWVGYEDAVNYAERFDGIGFEFTNSPFVGIDIDHCIAPDGNVSDTTKDIAKNLNSYTEYSPSGTGLHIIVKSSFIPLAENKKGGVRKNGLEIYHQGQFLTMTGNRLEGSPIDIMDRTNQLKGVYEKYIFTEHQPSQQADKKANKCPQGEYKAVSLSVEKILEKALNSNHRNPEGLTFSDLYNGNWDGHYINENQSGADLALCDALAYWTAKDPAKMDEIFRQSALMRPKWDEVHDGNNGTYGVMTINRAISTRSTVYNPNYYKEQKQKVHQEQKEKDDYMIHDCCFPVTETNCNNELVPIKTAIENTEYILGRLGIQVRYNVLSNEVEFTGRKEFTGITFDSALALLRSIFHKNGLKISRMDLCDNVGYVAEKNEYSPVVIYLNECQRKWDRQQGRIFQLFNSFEIDESQPVDKEFMFSLFKKWLLSCVKLAFNDGSYSAQGILILKGDQGIGKTRFLCTLVKNPAWRLDGVMLDPTNKDDIMKINRHWIVELGEFNDTLKKDKIDRIKAFITTGKDAFRRPYKRAVTSEPRRTAMFGTVNDDSFLKDRTGERRFWVLPVKSIQEDSSLDINQLWGEVMYLAFEVKEPDWLNKAEIEKLNIHNEKYKKITSEEQTLLDMLDWDAPEASWQWRTASEICDSVGVQRTRNRLIGKALRRLSGLPNVPTSKIQCPTNNRDKSYLIPPVKNHFNDSPW